MDEHLLQQYPAWREAVRAFFQAQLAPGDLVSFDWLYQHFMIERPCADTPLAEAQKAELRFLSQFKEFEDSLLTEHQIALANVRGLGYRVVPAAEQTRWAEGAGIGEVKKAVRKLADRLTNVDLAQLTSEQRRENADALARMAMLAGMTKEVTKRSAMPQLVEPGEHESK